jgi:hypothetical protein
MITLPVLANFMVFVYSRTSAVHAGWVFRNAVLLVVSIA